MTPRQRSPLGAIVLNVALIHAAALVLLNQSQADTVGRGGPTSGPVAIQTRLIPALPAGRPAGPASPAPSLALEPDPAPAPPPVMPENPVTSIAEQTASEALPPDQTGNGPAGSEYIPRPRLTSAPKPYTPVVIPFPKEVTEPGRYTAILALFIDETGVVRRVRFDGHSLPPPLEDAARETFLQTQFRPGELGGQHVKSLIRIEVVFDNAPIAAPTATLQASSAVR